MDSSKVRLQRFKDHGFHWPTTSFLIDEKKVIPRSRRITSYVDEINIMNKKPIRESTLAIGEELEKISRRKNSKQVSNGIARKLQRSETTHPDDQVSGRGFNTAKNKKSFSVFGKTFGKSFDSYLNKNRKKSATPKSGSRCTSTSSATFIKEKTRHSDKRIERDHRS